MATRRPKVVLLDAGETLIGPRVSFGEVYARVLAPFGVAADGRDLERALRATWERVNREIPPGTDRYGYYPGGEAEYWLRFVARTLEGVDGIDARSLAPRVLGPLRDAFRDADAWIVYPDVVPALDALREHGVRLGVVSNWDSRLRGLLGRLNLEPYFDAITVSHEEGIEKPHPELFRRALARLDAAPGEALHVGDVPELDGAGAAAAGIPSMLIDRRGRLAPEHGAKRDMGAVVERVRGGAV